MAAFNLAPVGNGWQFFGGNTAGSNPNLPLAAGTLRTFAAGTSTPLATFSNNLGSIQNAVQIVLDSTGRPPGEIWFANGIGYKFTLNDSLGNQIWSMDNLVGVNDSAAVSTGVEWTASNATPVFSNGTTFTTTGNTVGVFQVGRRIQAQVTAGLVYGTITSSTFAAGSTTVVLVMDSTALDNGLNLVNVGILGELNPSVPAIINYAQTFGVISSTNATLTTATINGGTQTGVTYSGTIAADGNMIHIAPVCFHAPRITTNQTAGTTVIFNSTDFQLGGTNYSTATGIFTAPFNGIYQFNASVASTNTTGGNVAEIVTINAPVIGTVSAYTEVDVATTLSVGLNVSVIVQLAATQTARVIFPNIGVTNPVLFGSSFFSGFMLCRTS